MKFLRKHFGKVIVMVVVPIFLTVITPISAPAVAGLLMCEPTEMLGQEVASRQTDDSDLEIDIFSCYPRKGGTESRAPDMSGLLFIYLIMLIPGILIVVTFVWLGREMDDSPRDT